MHKKKDCNCPACNPVIKPRAYEETPKPQLTLKEKLAQQRLQNHLDSEARFSRIMANGKEHAELRSKVLSERGMAKTGYLDSFKESVSDKIEQVSDTVSNVVDDVVGAAKQVGNDFIASQHSVLAEHLADKGVIHVTDTSTGEKLTPDEVAERYSETSMFDISDAEKSGANAIKSMPAYGSVLLAAETAATKGRNIVRDPESLASNVVKKENPTIAFSKKETPNIAENIENAQNNGAPKTLNRAANKSAIRKNRREALRGQTAPEKGLSLDEYPFASSQQGGAGAFVKPVPVSEQNIQGGKLSSFYKKHGLVDGDEFDVDVVD